ncbi:MAG: hypothetical protein ACJAWV_002511 [Flammeovirgaceae bacterium]|jgi:hypothetical protein
MKLVKVFIYQLIIVFVLTSCGENTLKPEANYSIDRIEFLKGKTSQEQKSIFAKLTSEEKLDLWRSKFSQILDSDLNVKQKEVIGSMLIFLNKTNSITGLKENNEFKNLAIKSTSVLSYEQFTNMFLSLEDYQNIESKPVQTEHYLKSKLLSDFNSTTKIQDSINKNSDSSTHNKVAETPECNCSWTCNDDIATTKCTETQGGCGFLFLSDCKIYG